MPSKIKVSIIVPAYNVASYIHECLESLAKQSLEDIEILVVDNNSTDETHQIIDEFAKRYPEKIVPLHQPVQGPSAARNKGLECARGKYIGFVDGDDSVQPDMYEKLYNAAEENRSDLVICDWFYVRYEGNEVAREMAYQSAEPDICTNIFQTPKIFDICQFPWNKLYRSEVIKRNHLIFDTELIYCEDVLFNVKYLFYAENVLRMAEPLYLYTARRIGSITGTFNENIMSQILFCEKATQFYIKNGYLKLFETQLLWVFVGHFRRKFNDAFKSKERALAIKFIRDCLNILDRYYPRKGKIFLRKYGTKGSIWKYIKNFYLTSNFLLTIRIYSPKWLIKLLADLANLKKQYSYVRNVNERFIKFREKRQINNRQILFQCSGGLLACNLYYMLEELHSRGKYEIYILDNGTGKNSKLLHSKGIKAHLVKANSPSFINALATSKYIVMNHALPHYFIKRDEQVLINTWHGTPLKYLGFHMLSDLGDVAYAQTHFLASDYLLYPNIYTKEKMMHGYALNQLFKNKVLVTGYPRNSIFFKTSTHEHEAIKANLGLHGKRIIVYMPTWRGSSIQKKNQPYLDKTEKFLREIDDNLDENIVLFAKMHNVARKEISGYKRIRPFPINLEVYELLNIADCLITDYSSVFYDFACTGKEIILFAFDADSYSRERGLYISLDELPFARVKTVKDLIEHINASITFEKDDRYSAFQKEYCQYDSILAPKYINDVLLDSNELECGQIFDFTNNEKQNFHVYFASDLRDASQLDEVFSLIQSDPNALLVLPKRNFSARTNELIRKVVSRNQPCLIVNTKSPVTVREYILLMLYRKTGLLKKMARKICLREKERIFPGLTVSRYEDLSDEKLFHDMARLL